MSQSKQYIIYKNKTDQFNADVELIDIICESYAKQCQDLDTLFPESDRPIKYPTLSKWKVSPHNRRKAIGHLANTLFSSYIKDLYEEFSLYLRAVVRESYVSAKGDPNRIAGNLSNASLSYSDILTFFRDGTLVDEIINGIFKKLEAERSDTKLVKQFADRVGLTIDETLISDAVNCLDVRHVLVHADGIVDDRWLRSHPDFKANLDEDGKRYIKLTKKSVLAAKKKIDALVLAIDNQALEKGFLKENTPSVSAE